MTKNGNGTSGLGHGYYFEDLAVGMEASVSKKITNEDVLAFADLPLQRSVRAFRRYVRRLGREDARPTELLRE